jgi:hypothetical protein
LWHHERQLRRRLELVRGLLFRFHVCGGVHGFDGGFVLIGRFVFRRNVVVSRFVVVSGFVIRRHDVISGFDVVSRFVIRRHDVVSGFAFRRKRGQG